MPLPMPAVLCLVAFPEGGDMQRPKDQDEHAETEVLDSDGDSTPKFDPDATAVLDDDYPRMVEDSKGRRSK